MVGAVPRNPWPRPIRNAGRHGQRHRIGGGRPRPWINRTLLAMSQVKTAAHYQKHGAVGRHGNPAAPFVAGRMVVPWWLAAGDAVMRAIRRLPNEDRMRSIRAGVTTVRRDSRIGISANDNRKTVE